MKIWIQARNQKSGLPNQKSNIKKRQGVGIQTGKTQIWKHLEIRVYGRPDGKTRQMVLVESATIFMIKNLTVARAASPRAQWHIPSGTELWVPLFRCGRGTPMGMVPIRLWKGHHLPVLFYIRSCWSSVWVPSPFLLHPTSLAPSVDSPLSLSPQLTLHGHPSTASALISAPHSPHLIRSSIHTSFGNVLTPPRGWPCLRLYFSFLCFHSSPDILKEHDTWGRLNYSYQSGGTESSVPAPWLGKKRHHGKLGEHVVEPSKHRSPCITYLQVAWHPHGALNAAGRAAWTQIQPKLFSHSYLEHCTRRHRNLY